MLQTDSLLSRSSSVGFRTSDLQNVKRLPISKRYKSLVVAKYAFYTHLSSESHDAIFNALHISDDTADHLFP